MVKAYSHPVNSECEIVDFCAQEDYTRIHIIRCIFFFLNINKDLDGKQSVYNITFQNKSYITFLSLANMAKLVHFIYFEISYYSYHFYDMYFYYNFKI